MQNLPGAGEVIYFHCLLNKRKHSFLKFFEASAFNQLSNTIIVRKH